MIDFEQTWALARRWYDGRAEPTWRGRTAEEAQSILVDVGLTGEFWRLV